jgi:hypothetical protein
MTQPLEKLDYQRLGPFTIIKKINEVAFQLKLLNSMKIHHVFHFFNETLSCIDHSKKSAQATFTIEINGEQEYEMEENLDLKISNN